ncbi:hypothetical protein [Mycoplasmopsis columbinasalis]|uniref:Uncharacterized protein n=1 Tax=Mycoplasmopsis columbinasalis TaxID=114880 RepID=A0A449BBB2_9BACT|nr:hypothetical protein [Mycoplasmopsis columbinasalis]VEU78330.1 Uncharacterised protein [Mycoplasmopsis columbinasalis]
MSDDEALLWEKPTLEQIRDLRTRKTNFLSWFLIILGSAAIVAPAIALTDHYVAIAKTKQADNKVLADYQQAQKEQEYYNRYNEFLLEAKLETESDPEILANQQSVTLYEKLMFIQDYLKLKFNIRSTLPVAYNIASGVIPITIDNLDKVTEANFHITVRNYLEIIAKELTNVTQVYDIKPVVASALDESQREYKEKYASYSTTAVSQLQSVKTFETQLRQRLMSTIGSSDIIFSIFRTKLNVYDKYVVLAKQGISGFEARIANGETLTPDENSLKQNYEKIVTLWTNINKELTSLEKNLNDAATAYSNDLLVHFFEAMTKKLPA